MHFILTAIFAACVLVIYHNRPEIGKMSKLEKINFIEAVKKADRTSGKPRYYL